MTGVQISNVQHIIRSLSVDTTYRKSPSVIYFRCLYFATVSGVL